MLAPAYRYLGNDANILSLESLRNMYQITTDNLRKARLRKLPHSATQLSRTLQVGDLVLIKNHTTGPFEPKYSSPSRVLGVHGNRVELVPATGRHVKNGT